MENVDTDELSTALTVFRPTEIVEISVGELTAPIQTGVELSKLASIEKIILLDLLTHSLRDPDTDQLIPHPDALAWARELRMLYGDIHALTSGVQEKVMMKKMDIIGALYKEMVKNKDPKDVINTIRELQDVSSSD